MKKFIVLILSLLLISFFTQCGKKDESPHPQAKEEKGEPQQPGKKDRKAKAGKNDEEIDIDKLDIPDRMKQAIKSGRIPKERVKEFLEMRKSGANFPAVKVERVQRQKINAFLVLNGVVEPERKVEVYSRLSTFVKNVIREEGDFVKKGDVLALLDDTEIIISYRQAQIQLEQAKLTLKDEETNYRRSEELKKTEMISEQDIQLSQATYNKAKLDLQTKLENFKDLELQLSYTKIKSPVEGYVTERLMEVGSRVNANQHVYTVEDFSPLLVRVYVPTADIVNLKTEMEAQVVTDVLKGMVFEGRVKLINPRIDVQSGTIKVTVEVFDSTRKLKPGMFVETRIVVSNKPDALVVPRKSISFEQNQPYVFIFNFQGMQVSKQSIKTGISEGDYIEVVEGLKESDRIVTVGVEGLKDQMKVRVAR
ncbi:efflux RND transporter periplasmic adaptor subunit [Acidobacteriota bacterium]